MFVKLMKCRLMLASYLQFKTNYKNGKQEGIHERFNEKGKLLSITTYKTDLEVSKKNQLSIWVLNRIKF